MVLIIAAVILLVILLIVTILLLHEDIILKMHMYQFGDYYLIHDIDFHKKYGDYNVFLHVKTFFGFKIMVNVGILKNPNDEDISEEFFNIWKNDNIKKN